ncbi:homoserine dehydrogenase [Aneurinibacillus soli]|uniref:Homoserine dehydrogenase n=1 Tax=Aneurinibacillus soli TaxID=1500254 RepID=A0A0U5BBN8_9BACL|nr:homoserine dehydrogenase [Aneurinibacillus soli]PYE64383.1 homoserine dehydrogenase [Aneurinibacillus soli]BAU28332.1 Homoserine dehydrogenase [Aneurinibacillus soli]
MKNVRIALLGLGTVGSGVVTILQTHAERLRKQTGTNFEIAGILVRDTTRSRQVDVERSLLTTDIARIWESKPDVVVDAMGGLVPTLGYIEEAIARGCHVVSANKELIAVHGARLHALAGEQGVGLLYEASVGGGIPVLNTLAQLLNVNRITRVAGILNGTTNYILTRMEEDGLPYEAVLAQAQELGFAEADPTADVEGYDAFHKIRIVARLCFGEEVEEEVGLREGITSVTAEEIELYGRLGLRVKLLATAERTKAGLRVQVAPTLVPHSHALSHVKNEYNGVFVTGDVVGDLFFTGKGAGMLPTGSAIVEDIVHAVRGITFTPETAVATQAVEIKAGEGAAEETGLEIAFFSLKHKDERGEFSLLSFLSGEAGVLHGVETVKRNGQTHVAALLSSHDRAVSRAFAHHIGATVRFRELLAEPAPGIAASPVTIG